MQTSPYTASGADLLPEQYDRFLRVRPTYTVRAFSIRRLLRSHSFRTVRTIFVSTIILAFIFSPIAEILIPLLPNIFGSRLKVQQAYAGLDTQVFITVASNSALGNLWTVPADWNNASNSIEVLGGGGNGADGAAGGGGGSGRAGGGGAAYAKVTNQTLSGSVGFNVGAGGFVNGNGERTWFCNSSSNCTDQFGSAVIAAVYGGQAGVGVTGGASGTVATGTGFSGGVGVNGGGNGQPPGGGGGAAGPHGAGNTGSGLTGGTGDAGFTAATANGTQWRVDFGSGGGGTGTTTVGGSGGLYGAGGAGGRGSGNAGGAGKNGLIVVTYRALASITPTATGTQTATIVPPESGTTSTLIGGAFKMTSAVSTVTITSIAVTASTSSGNVTGLDDVKLYWDTDATCSTANPIATATLFNTASASFSSMKATVSGSTTVAVSTPKCFYPVLDVSSSVNDELRFDIKIQASTDIVSDGVELGTYPVAISGVTVFSITDVLTQRAYVFQNDDATNSNPNSNSNSTASNTSLTGVKNGQRFIARFQLDSNVTKFNKNYIIQYDKNDNNWRPIGIASAAFAPAPLMSFGAVATSSLTTNVAGTCAGGMSYTNGQAVANSGMVNRFSLDANKQCTEFAFGLRTASVSYNTTYRFRLLEWTSSSSYTFSQYPTVATVTSANDTIRYSKFLIGPSISASASYRLPAPLDTLGYASISTDNSKFDVLASQSNLFFQDQSGLYKTASESVNTIGWNGTYWLVGEKAGKLVRISQTRDGSSPTDVSANLVGFGTNAINSVYWNGTYWLVGGVTAKLNRCNSDASSCTDVTANLVGFGIESIKSLYWNGTYWLVGGTGAILNRCNSDASSCTNVSANLVGFGTNAINSVYWNGTYWLVGGGTDSNATKLNRCNSDASSCTDVTANLVNFGTDWINSIHWNGTYWLVGGGTDGFGPILNRCNSDASSCSGVTANLVGFGVSAIKSLYWNGTYWLVGGTGNGTAPILNRCNSDASSCTNVSANLAGFNTGNINSIYWNGTYWLVGGGNDGFNAILNRCSLDSVVCEDLANGVINFGTQSVMSVAFNDTNQVWLIGGSNAKLNAASASFQSFADKSPQLIGFGTNAIFSIYWNGTYWLVGGTGAKLNRCNSDASSCTDVSTNLVGFGTSTIRSVYWNGTYWLVGGGDGGPKFNRCNSDASSCTDVSANLVGFGINDINSVYWNGTYWLVGGVTAKLNRCNSDASSCTDVSANLVGFGTNPINSVYWNGTYWLVGGTGAKLNRCNSDASSCTDVSANLVGFAGVIIRSIHWNGTYWLVGGNDGKLNRCNSDASSCTNVSANSHGFGTNEIFSIYWNGTYWLVGGGDGASGLSGNPLNRIYERFPVYHFEALNPNGNNTDDITVTWNGKSSMSAASKSFTLQAYNWSTKKWNTISTNSSLAADTEGTITGSIIADNGFYYGSGNYTHWRFYQQSGLETVRTDYVNFAFSGVVNVSRIGGGGGVTSGGGSAGGSQQSGGGGGGGGGGSENGQSGGGSQQGGGGAGGGGGSSPTIFNTWSFISQTIGGFYNWVRSIF